MNQTNSCIARVKSEYNTLRSSEKKVADFVLKNSGAITSLSLSQLAAGAGVSEPSVMRFVKSIGFTGYRDFKLALAVESGREAIDDELLVDLHISKDDKLEDLPSKMIAMTTKALEDTLKIIDLNSYKRAVTTILGAKSIDIYGVGNSGSVANDMMNRFLRLGIRCRALADSHLQQICACHLEAGDLAIGISHSGSTIDTVDALRIAGQSGAQTMAITNFKSSVITKVADFSLLTGDFETTFYSETTVSRISQLALVDMLYMGVLLSDYDLFTKRLDKLNTQVSQKVY
ncbi:MurR/RpiR family transcriptional regulator [Hydrogenoanaerobacterium sp.]|uniref:MurR/RpiR family transcriptional regulator n=1 Tax=Hydrogenoanaerobacterium sp. TaxID=2953763 RepID=UPI00289A48C1|nr:MurR/RpiR family transcriptional regulator [Hydrogenoanaerobacterium sp.]